MRHTFWHAGQMIGEADLEPNPKNLAQRAGIFFPTAYGHTLVPQLTGILTKQLNLKRYLDSIGRAPDSLSGEELEELFERTDAGRAVIDHGRMMSEITVQGPKGGDVEFESIGFSEVEELRNLGRSPDAPPLDPLPSDAPRFLCSFTARVDPWRAVARVRATH